MHQATSWLQEKISGQVGEKQNKMQTHRISLLKRPVNGEPIVRSNPHFVGWVVRVAPILTSDLAENRTVTAHSKSNEYFAQKYSIFWPEHNQSTVSKKRKSWSYQNDITWHFIIIGESAINRVIAMEIIEFIFGNAMKLSFIRENPSHKSANISLLLFHRKQPESPSKHHLHR